RALYIFPTKALAQDQLRALKELAANCLPDLKVETYDGDTPQAQRTGIRAQAQVILTNPDMLSLGILPNHAIWSRFFSNLKYVVVDEAHIYRGVFGSHVANVLRRLRRVCAHYGATPQFICCSATVANPGEHMARIVGVEPAVVDRDGSPHGPRDFALWNPPLVDAQSGARRSANSEATHLFVELVMDGIRNITFTRSRRTAELIQLYARGVLSDQAPKLVDKVRTYRAGYLPKQRREIEQGLFKGRITGVTATNALELGVDIGDLDATVLVGYPGTIASTWQQAGRAGRGEAHSLSFLVGLDGPLDQYLMRHPDYLFKRPIESVLIDPSNPYILPAHLCAAAFELPLTNADEALFGGEAFVQAMIGLEQRHLLEYRQERWYFMGMGYPAEEVHIRSSTGEQFDIVDSSAGYTLLESIDAATALYQVHPGAVYLHQGESYLVKELDLLSRTAYVVPTEAKFYTQSKDSVDVHIVRSTRSRLVGRAPGTPAYLGVVRVRTQVIGYRKKRQYTDEVLDEVPLNLPPTEFDTVAVWWDLPDKLIRQLKTRGRDVPGGLHAMEHACIGMLPLFAMCDRLDLGGLSTECHVNTGQPQVFVYDAFPGGVGIAEKGFNILEQWWAATLQAIVECPCEDGCPSCVQSPRCGNNNDPLDKDVARIMLEALTR
ncbi:MAG: DEAD/DEAH box helicase, partial [Chloroflexi bacterium]|nr:DEAD/DEAH box helicase [Chloroflexota bacterium]